MSDEKYNPCLNHGIRRCTICIANPVGYVVVDESERTTHGDPFLSPWQTNPTAGTSEDAAAQLDMARDLTFGTPDAPATGD